MTNSSSAAHTTILKVARRKHPLLADVIKITGCIEIGNSRGDCIVQFLAGTVISQQLSTKASSTIWGRVCDLRDQQGDDFRELFTDRYFNNLHECGISRAKVRAMIQMNDAFRTGNINEKGLASLNYDEISNTITSLWGFGQWSADMVAMFFVKLPDVWPESDVALIRGLRSLAPGEDPMQAASHYSPYRTYLARYVWTALDTGLIGE
jgi:DNA-3-methyladenine glycosylase II